MFPPPWPRQSAQFALFFFGYYGYVGVFAPYASLYFADAGMTVAQIGVLMALMQVMRIFGPNLWGWAADQGQQRVLVVRLTCGAALVCASGFAFGSSFVQFFLLMAALNLFTSAQAPLAEAMMLSEMRGDLTYYGRLRLWGSVGFIVAVTLAGPLLDLAGIATLPWLAAGLLGVVLLAALYMDEASPPAARAEVPTLLTLLRRPDVLAFFVSSFLMIAAHAALYVYYSLYLAQIGYSKTVIGLMWGLGVVVEIVFFYYQAPLFRRFGLRRLMLASLVLAVLRFLLIGFGAAWLWILLVAQVLHAATFATHHSAAIAMLQRWFAGPMQARGQALYTSISYGLGGTAGALVLSPLWDTFGAPAVYLAAALLALAATVAMLACQHWQHADPTASG